MTSPIHLVSATLGTGIALGLGGPAPAQLPDHYSAYEFVERTPAMTAPFQLIDQWGTSTLFVALSDRLFVPTDRDDDTIQNPDLFYTQYFIGVGDEESRQIAVTNAFGAQQAWTIDGSFGLLTPSLKHEPGGSPPVANHYMCYLADGPPINVSVTLTDQFGTYDVTIREPVYWCNPAEMVILEQAFPIVDEDAWLGCYFTEPATFLVPPIPVGLTDTFGVSDQQLVARDILCVRSLKEPPTPVETVSWGQLKTTYR